MIQATEQTVVQAERSVLQAQHIQAIADRAAAQDVQQQALQKNVQQALQDAQKKVENSQKVANGFQQFSHSELAKNPALKTVTEATIKALQQAHKAIIITQKATAQTPKNPNLTLQAQEAAIAAKSAREAAIVATKAAQNYQDPVLQTVAQQAAQASSEKARYLSQLVAEKTEYAAIKQAKAAADAADAAQQARAAADIAAQQARAAVYTATQNPQDGRLQSFAQAAADAATQTEIVAQQAAAQSRVLATQAAAQELLNEEAQSALREATQTLQKVQSAVDATALAKIAASSVGTSASTTGTNNNTANTGGVAVMNGRTGTSQRTNPRNYITANRFYIEMDSTLTASFSECSGFGVNLKKEAYLEGGANDRQRIVVGHAEFDDITLKRGMSDSQTFWSWVFKNFNQPKKERRNINIVLFNQAGETMQAWTLIGSIPISWKAPAFQAEGSSVAIEELTLAYEGLKLTTSGGGGASIVTRDAVGDFSPN